MVKNQLFRILPDIDIINSILDTFGLTSLDDTKFFTKETLQENNTIKKMYVNDITDKRCIVILRQFIKSQGYTLISKERYINGKKMSVYRLLEDDNQDIIKKNKPNKPIVISFQ